MKTGVQTKTCPQVFIASLFTIAKRGKQPKRPSADDMGKQNIAYPYNGILLSHKKELNTNTCYKWMILENIMLSNKKASTYHMILFI